MRFPSPVLGATMLALSLALAGCSSSDAEQASPETATAPTTSTTIDPFVVPEVIDAAYVDKVLSEIYKTRDEITQSVSRTQQFTPEDEAKLRSIYFGDLANRQVEVFRRGAQQTQPETYKTEFSKVSTERVVRSTQSCIYSESRITGPGGSTVFGYVFAADTAEAANPTGWKISQGTLPAQVVQERTC